MPTGIVSVVYPTINVLAEKFSASSRAFGFEKKSLVVDWFDGNARVSASRNVKENIVDFNIADENSHKEISFKMFYSDLPSKDYIIDLYDHTDISELFSKNNFLSIACADSLTASDVDISKIYYNIDYRFQPRVQRCFVLVCHQWSSDRHLDHRHLFLRNRGENHPECRDNYQRQGRKNCR